MLTIRREQFLRGLLSLMLIVMVGVTTYVANRPRPQRVTSEAESPCSAVIKIVPEIATYAPGQKFFAKVLADLGTKHLMTAIVTLDYDPSKISLIGGQMQEDGSRIIVDYERDPRLLNELAAIVELPDLKKINVLASCAVNALGQCNTSVSGDNVLLATLPIQIQEDTSGAMNLDFQYTDCGDADSQSVVIEDTGSVEENSDILGFVQPASYTIIPLVTSNPTLTATPTLIPVKGDITQDGTVDARDASVLVSNWRKSAFWQCPSDVPDCNPDLDGNGVVEGRDASILVGNWSRST